MKKMAALLAGAALTLTTASAMATTLDPYNLRQVTINTAAAGESSLQTELDKIFGAGKIDATKDQLSAGMFAVSTPSSTGILPQLKFEYTANSATQGMGIFGWDGGNAIKAQLFGGSYDKGDQAIVSWFDNDSGQILSMNFRPGQSTLYNTQDFDGISRNFFGFYFQANAGSNPTYYSVDSLNPDGTLHQGTPQARVLAFNGADAGIANGGIAFSYEDGTDFDYQDGGFFVESINPVPEPGTMLLLGAGFLGLAIYGKRRKNA